MRQPPRTRRNGNEEAKLSGCKQWPQAIPPPPLRVPRFWRGGRRADAAVAASLASCVAETVMTGLLGGGHGIYHDAGTGTTANLDCFVAVPGSAANGVTPSSSSCRCRSARSWCITPSASPRAGFPGLPAGLGALWTEHGRLPWARLVEPAMRLAAEGVAMPAAQASCLQMLATVMTMNEGPASSPGGSLLEEGDLLHQPGLVAVLESLAEEGAAAFTPARSPARCSS